MESYQSLETNKGYGRQREKTWAHQKIQKYQMYFYFNQLVEPAYSTDGEQNAQCESKKQCQKVLKQMPQLIM